MTTQISERVEQDNEIMQRLHALQAQHQAGTISATEYAAAFQALNQTVGTPCACGRGMVSVQPLAGGPAICAACWLDGVRR